MDRRILTRRTLASLAALTVAAALLATPGLADTKGQLDSAKERLASLQNELDQATARYEAAHVRYIQTSGQIRATEADMRRTLDRIRGIREALSARARSVYETGIGGTLDMLLSSGSIGEFSDRLEFLGQVTQSDTTLVALAQVSGERLRRERSDLTALAADQQAAASALYREQSAIESHLSDVQSQVADLTEQLKAEARTQAALALYGVHVVSGGALSTCPVAGPHSYVDSFGAPRVGHTHQGDDIMSPRGTPVVAAQTGNAVQTPNSLGGNAMIVYADNGDYTYYAHLDSYGASGHVSAGTQIGTVGNTGNASGGPTHLHFEYHPGGGAAVDPTPYLDAVC